MLFLKIKSNPVKRDCPAILGGGGGGGGGWWGVIFPDIPFRHFTVVTRCISCTATQGSVW